MRDVLGDVFEQKQLPQQFRYGSDCSGVDAPMWALQQIVSDLKDSDSHMIWCGLALSLSCHQSLKSLCLSVVHSLSICD